MAQERRHKKRRRNRARFPGLYRLVSVILILAALVAACVIFFRVEEITIQGNTRYTDQQIIEAAGIERGKNLFSVNKSRVARELLGKLPYIQSVSVRRKLPDTLSITVSEGNAAAAIAQGGKWWLVGINGKLLEEANSAPQNCAQVIGLTPLAPAVGTYLAAEEAQAAKVENLQALLPSLAETELLERVESIDLSEDYEVVFQCDGRFTVSLSTTLEKGMDYWVRRFAAYVDAPGVAENQSYDVKIRDGEVRFIPRKEK